MLSAVSRPERIFLGIYATIAALQVAVVLAKEGLSADNVTRLLILAYLVATLAWWLATRRRARAVTPVSFVLRCSLNAMFVEATYMISRPVFSALLVTRETPVGDALTNTLIDFAFTFPVYVALYSIVWLMIRRFPYRISEYVVVFSLAQSLGDGNAFFLANPAMLAFAPWVMLNYQAINIVPYLIVRPSLPARASTSALAAVARIAVPLVSIPVAYWFLGAAIQVIGREVGLR